MLAEEGERERERSQELGRGSEVLAEEGERERERSQESEVLAGCVAVNIHVADIHVSLLITLSERKGPSPHHTLSYHLTHFLLS